jgi:hypothetical protein
MDMEETHNMESQSNNLMIQESLVQTDPTEQDISVSSLQRDPVTPSFQTSSPLPRDNNPTILTNITSPSTENPILPSSTTVKVSELEVRRHVAVAVKIADWNTVTTKQIRRAVEKVLNLPQDYLARPEWRKIVKEVIKEAMTIETSENDDPLLDELPRDDPPRDNLVQDDLVQDDLAQDDLAQDDMAQDDMAQHPLNPEWEQKMAHLKPLPIRHDTDRENQLRRESPSEISISEASTSEAQSLLQLSGEDITEPAEFPLSVSKRRGTSVLFEAYCV